MKLKSQVAKEHYFKDYDTKERWMSYWYQINELLAIGPKKVLEIGIGNKIVNNCLKIQGIKIVSVDIDEKLEPDYVCSVTELNRYFRESSFDTVLCAEVLEHLPFEYFEKSLKEIQRVAKRYTVITLPYSGIKISLTIRIPFLRISKSFPAVIPFPRKHKFDREHYWEVGKKGYSLNKIMKIMDKFFKIKKRYFIPENPNHIMFVLQKQR